MQLSESRSAELSALFDGEVDRRDFRAAVDGALQDPEGLKLWQRYSMIGDHLRRESCDVPDLTASIMARISEEPVVIAPQRLRQTDPQHPLLALAASVAGVSLVAWLAFSGQPLSTSSHHLAAVPPASTFGAVATVSHYPVHTVAQKAKKFNEKGIMVIGSSRTARQGQ